MFGHASLGLRRHRQCPNAPTHPRENEADSEGLAVALREWEWRSLWWGRWWFAPVRHCLSPPLSCTPCISSRPSTPSLYDLIHLMHVHRLQLAYACPFPYHPNATSSILSFPYTLFRQHELRYFHGYPSTTASVPFSFPTSALLSSL